MSLERTRKGLACESVPPAAGLLVNQNAGFSGVTVERQDASVQAPIERGSCLGGWIKPYQYRRIVDPIIDQRRLGQRTVQPRPVKLAPERLALLIVHDQCVMQQLAGYSEDQW